MKRVNLNIDHEVKATLSSLDNIKRATPKPFLYTRIQARLQKTLHQPVISFIPGSSLIRVIVSIVIFLIILNAYTVSTVQKTDTPTVQAASVDDLQNFIGDYYQQTPTVYTLDELNNQ